jgi:thiol-disulfide isomerase/thioredoxin
MKKVIKWNIVGFLLFLLFVPILKLEKSYLIHLWSLSIYFLTGISLGKKFEFSQYFILLPLNLIISIIALFSNPQLFPLIFPLVNIYSVLGFLFGVNSVMKNLKLVTLYSFLLIILSIYLNKIFIPNFSFNKAILDPSKYPNPKNIEISNLDNKTIFDSDREKHILILNFTFVGCTQCVIKNPYLENIYSKLKLTIKIRVIDVYLESKNSPVEIKSYLQKHPTKLEIAYDKNNQLATIFNYDGAPHEVILTKDLKVVRIMSGFNSDLKEEYLKNTIQLINSLE